MGLIGTITVGVICLLAGVIARSLYGPRCEDCHRRLSRFCAHCIAQWNAMAEADRIHPGHTRTPGEPA